MDIDDLEALEGDVLDELEVLDDIDAVEGTSSLAAARRRRAMEATDGILDAT